MKEVDIQDLGFQQELFNDYPGDTSYYYSYEIVKGLSLITNESGGHDWYVEVFNTETPLRFYQKTDIEKLLCILKKGLSDSHE